MTSNSKATKVVEINREEVPPSLVRPQRLIQHLTMNFPNLCHLHDESQSILSISAKELASRMNKVTSELEQCCTVLLDCRPFTAFNLIHIFGALNLNCSDRISKKRLKDRKVQIGDLIIPKCQKHLLEEGAGDIVLYDESSSTSSTSALLQLVISCLIEARRSIYILAGSENDASCRQRLADDGITHVLNTTLNIPHFFENDGITYRRLPASDSGCQNLKQFFEEAFRFIEEARICGGSVLIHCLAGISRSPTVTVAYLMKRSEYSMVQAYDFVKDRRPVISPNFNFLGQLLEFERELNEGGAQRVLEPELCELEG